MNPQNFWIMLSTSWPNNGINFQFFIWQENRRRDHFAHVKDESVACPWSPGVLTENR